MKYSISLLHSCCRKSNFPFAAQGLVVTCGVVVVPTLMKITRLQHMKLQLCTCSYQLHTVTVHTQGCPFIFKNPPDVIIRHSSVVVSAQHPILLLHLLKRPILVQIDAKTFFNFLIQFENQPFFKSIVVNFSQIVRISFSSIIMNLSPIFYGDLPNHFSEQRRVAVQENEQIIHAWQLQMFRQCF